MSFLPPSARRRGFTMLELMIAVSVSVVVVAGLYALFVGQSRAFLFQDLRQNMNQNSRFAADIISRSGRMAGYGTGGTVTGALGWDGSSVDTTVYMPAIISHDAWEAENDTDAVTFVYADPSVEMMTTVGTIEDCSTSSIKFDMARPGYDTTIEQYASGEYLMCWDYAPIADNPAWLWEISAAGDSSTGLISVVDNTGYSDYLGDCDGNLPPVMHCSRATIVTYYIDNTDNGVGPGSPEHPVLMMDLDFDFVDGTPDADDIPLVDDIEDLQFEYCLEGDDCTDDSNYVDDMSLVEGTSAWLMRFHVSARSRKEDTRGLYTSAPLTLANHTSSGTEDYFWRQAMTSSVTFANLRVMYAP
ncbi:MAG: prepilin-type N-terminal cleavage/methylation domain-containing protein [Proteobacteria bacterium]|nr:prepilin-type N-terminal cleavage/methylation domain-containing protein [Pseudomonadota bacterium]MCP4917685.1 prepilin-type N-terminal cleavage/methylation domain-containing protein [Pseudomonadota bacterium]